MSGATLERSRVRDVLWLVAFAAANLLIAGVLGDLAQAAPMPRAGGAPTYAQPAPAPGRALPHDHRG